MNKKAGIVTFHNALNYGAMLQSYALQQFLLQNHIDNEIIDYQCDFMNKNYKSLIKIVKGARIKSFVGSLLKLKNKKESLRLSKEFQNRFLICSPSVTRNTLSGIVDKYIFFIAGSDQVWSPTCVGFDKTYFLDFAKSEQKYSYAASFGTNTIPNDKIAEYKVLLSDFQHHSVREQSGAELVAEITGRKADVNVDPTLLLTTEEWDKITVKPLINKPYIFLFNVLKPKKMIEYAVQLGKEKNMPVYYLNDKHLPISGINYLKPASPNEFVSLIKNAEYVVTNSFHGSVFSIIFHKELIMELDTETKRNTRSEELLNSLGIKNREIGEGLAVDPDAPIDWKYADAILDKQRNSARKYLCSVKKDC